MSATLHSAKLLLENLFPRQKGSNMPPTPLLASIFWKEMPDLHWFVVRGTTGEYIAVYLGFKFTFYLI